MFRNTSKIEFAYLKKMIYEELIQLLNKNNANQTNAEESNEDKVVITKPPGQGRGRGRGRPRVSIVEKDLEKVYRRKKQFEDYDVQQPKKKMRFEDEFPAPFNQKQIKRRTKKKSQVVIAGDENKLD
mgnify:CR=1 FL=1